MQRLQRLSGLDASFLYLETSTQPLHVCSVLSDTATIPGGYSFDDSSTKWHCGSPPSRPSGRS